MIEFLILWYETTYIVNDFEIWNSNKNLAVWFMENVCKIPGFSLKIAIFCFLAHLTQRVRWAIAITWRQSSSSVVHRKLFQKSSPLTVLDQWKPNLVWIITMVSSFKMVSGDAVHKRTWPLLLKIEHIVKLQVFGNHSKTVNNIKNLTRVKMFSTSRSTYPAILK